MEKKTCFVKEESIEIFKNNLIDFKLRNESEMDKAIRIISDGWVIGKLWKLPNEFLYPKQLLNDFEGVVFEVSDKTELTKIEFTSTFTYSVEPYDDVSVKLVLQSTDSVKK